MKGFQGFVAVVVVVVAMLWSATPAKTEDAWMAELKDDIAKTKLR